MEKPLIEYPCSWPYTVIGAGRDVKENLPIARSQKLPVERTLLTSGMTIFGVESLYQGEKLISTPELKVAYEAPSQSSFWRA